VRNEILNIINKRFYRDKYLLVTQKGGSDGETGDEKWKYKIWSGIDKNFLGQKAV
jgi:hypothetical protein